MLLRYNKGPIRANVELPASKSISNRMLILTEVLGLDLALGNLSESEDTLRLQEAISLVYGGSGARIDVGHAGTGLRFLAAWLSIKEGQWQLGGSERLEQRPISDLVTSLRSLGADISYLKQEGHAPLLIHGKKLKGGNVSIDPSISSQFVSALLLIAPSMEEGLIIHLKGEAVSQPYIQMTIDLLREFDVEVKVSMNSIEVKKYTRAGHSRFFKIENDWSAASYWYSLAALSTDAHLYLSGLLPSSIQGDSAVMNIFGMLGVDSMFVEGGLQLGKKTASLKKAEFNLVDTPDLAQTIAVTCFGSGIPCTLTGLSTLKHKETDRLAALKTELEKLGASVHVTGSTFEMAVPDNLSYTGVFEIDTYNDHRMAMAFAPLVLKYGELRINDAGVVKKSYPHFWLELEKAGINVS